MSGSLGKSESSSGSNNSFSQNVWSPQGRALQDLYGSAAGLFGKGSRQFPEQFQRGNQFAMNAMSDMVAPWQNQMQGGAYSGVDARGMVYDAQQQLANPTNYAQDIYSDVMGGAGNDYADAMRGQLTDDAERTLGMSLSALDQRAAASGMGGSSRHGVATGLIADDVNRNLQSELTGIGYSTFDQDLQNKLGIAQMADANALSSAQSNAQLAQNMMGGQQNAMSGGLGYGGQMMGYGMQQQMMPWQMAGAYANILGAPTVLGRGSAASSASGKGKSGSGGL